MRGRVASLNAAVAGSILLYEASSQRGGERPLIGSEPGTESEPDLAADPATAFDLAAAVDPGSLIAIEPAIPEKAMTAPGAAPKRRRRAATRQEPAELPAETEEDALLPGSSTIDSSDAAASD